MPGFVVSIVNSHLDIDKATVGFVVANAALGSDQDTTVFLSADGAWIAKRGEAEKLVADPPFAPLAELVAKFVANGGKILVCSPCMKMRGFGPDDMIDGAVPAGGAALVELLVNGAPCITY
jgi:predicted peroxiredoxin